MNIPNQLTCVRIALAGIFAVLILSDGPLFKLSALLAFFLASATDYWDGRIARKSGQITQFGKLMDPIADKLLTFSAFAAFVYLTLVPLWMVLVVVARDFIVTLWRLALPAEGDLREAKSSGKNKTALQFAFIVCVLIYLVPASAGRWPAAWKRLTENMIEWGMLGVTVLTLWSGIQALRKSPRPRTP